MCIALPLVRYDHHFLVIIIHHAGTICLISLPLLSSPVSVVDITVEHKTNDADAGTRTTYTDVIPTLCSFDSGTGNLNMYHKSGQSMVYPDNHNKITDMTINDLTRVVVTIITTKSNLDATIAGTPA